MQPETPSEEVDKLPTFEATPELNGNKILEIYDVEAPAPPPVLKPCSDELYAPEVLLCWLKFPIVVEDPESNGNVNLSMADVWEVP